jgi:hypothetical protein
MSPVPVPYTPAQQITATNPTICPLITTLAPLVTLSQYHSLRRCLLKVSVAEGTVLVFALQALQDVHGAHHMVLSLTLGYKEPYTTHQCVWPITAWPPWLCELQRHVVNANVASTVAVTNSKERMHPRLGPGHVRHLSSLCPRKGGLCSLCPAFLYVHPL